MAAGQQMAFAVSLLLAALAVWCLSYVVVISGVQHARSQHELYARLRAQLASATAPIGGTIAPGSPLAVITVPDAGLRSEVIVEGTTAGVLRFGPGHLRTTPLPGQPGNAIVYGRSLAFGAPFGRIGELRKNARINVVTDQGRFRFLVTGVRHQGDPIRIPAAGSGTLTLVTSEGGLMPDRVVYVDAALQGSAVQAPGGRPTSLSDQERLMSSDTDPLTLVQLVLWLQLLLVVACVVVWLRGRWGRWQVWIIGVPGVLAVLWGTSNTAVRLLPNLL